MVRQKPGGNNALGKIKFLFPNNFSIYLHDTPSKVFSVKVKGTSAMGASEWKNQENS